MDSILEAKISLVILAKEIQEWSLTEDANFTLEDQNYNVGHLVWYEGMQLVIHEEITMACLNQIQNTTPILESSFPVVNPPITARPTPSIDSTDSSGQKGSSSDTPRPSVPQTVESPSSTRVPNEGLPIILNHDTLHTMLLKQYL